MNSRLCQCDGIRLKALSLGAVACGLVKAAPVDDAAIDRYDRWVEQGHCGTMDYCGRYREVRNDPRLLLDGAKTIICCAFSYYNPNLDLPLSAKIAKYAWGDDYHWTIKSRLRQLGEYISGEYGGEYRVCVDSAPIRERYWAAKSGVGIIGVNNQLIVPGYGSYCFLGEVICTADIPGVTDGAAVSPGPACDGCMRCVQSCPGHALDGTGSCAAERCVSYLTIEHRGDLAESDNLGGYIYGCDVCQRVCPHNHNIAATKMEEFRPDMDFLALTTEDIAAMTPSHFRRLVRNKAMSRVTHAQLMRNINKKS